MIYLNLFLAYLKIGLFSIGGGHAAIPVVQSVIVQDKGWLTMQEFMDVITISELTPGPFALNSATFIGNKLGGILGGLIASFACILPSFFIIMILAIIYKKYRTVTAVNGALSGIKPATTGLIMAAGLSILFLSLFGTSSITLIDHINYISLAVTVIAFLTLKIFKKINPIYIMLGAGVLGLVLNIIIE